MAEVRYPQETVLYDGDRFKKFSLFFGNPKNTGIGDWGCIIFKIFGRWYKVNQSRQSSDLHTAANETTKIPPKKGSINQALFHLSGEKNQCIAINDESFSPVFVNAEAPGLRDKSKNYNTTCEASFAACFRNEGFLTDDSKLYGLQGSWVSGEIYEIRFELTAYIEGVAFLPGVRGRNEANLKNNTKYFKLKIGKWEKEWNFDAHLPSAELKLIGTSEISDYKTLFDQLIESEDTAEKKALSENEYYDANGNKIPPILAKDAMHFRSLLDSFKTNPHLTDEAFDFLKEVFKERIHTSDALLPFFETLEKSLKEKHAKEAFKDFILKVQEKIKAQNEAKEPEPEPEPQPDAQKGETGNEPENSGQDGAEKGDAENPQGNETEKGDANESGTDALKEFLEKNFKQGAENAEDQGSDKSENSGAKDENPSFKDKISELLERFSQQNQGNEGGTMLDLEKLKDFVKKYLGITENEAEKDALKEFLEAVESSKTNEDKMQKLKDFITKIQENIKKQNSQTEQGLNDALKDFLEKNFKLSHKGEVGDIFEKLKELFDKSEAESEKADAKTPSEALKEFLEKIQEGKKDNQKADALKDFLEKTKESLKEKPDALKEFLEKVKDSLKKGTINDEVKEWLQENFKHKLTPGEIFQAFAKAFTEEKDFLKWLEKWLESEGYKLSLEEPQETEKEEWSELEKRLFKAVNDNAYWLEQVKITLLTVEQLYYSFKKLESHYDNDLELHRGYLKESKDNLDNAKSIFETLLLKLKESDEYLHDTKQALEALKDKFKNELDKSDEALKEREKELKALCWETNAKSGEVLLFRQEILENIKLLKELVAEFDDIEAKREENKEILSELESLKTNLETLKNELETQQSEATNLKAELEEILSKIQSFNDTFNALMDNPEIADLPEAVESTKSELESFKTEQEAFKNEMQSFKTEQEAFKSELESKAEETRKDAHWLKSDLAEFKEAISEFLEKKAAELENEVESETSENLQKFKDFLAMLESKKGTATKEDIKEYLKEHFSKQKPNFKEAFEKFAEVLTQEPKQKGALEKFAELVEKSLQDKAKETELKDFLKEAFSKHGLKEGIKEYVSKNNQKHEKSFNNFAILTGSSEEKAQEAMLKKIKLKAEEFEEMQSLNLEGFVRVRKETTKLDITCGKGGKFATLEEALNEALLYQSNAHQNSYIDIILKDGFTIDRPYVFSNRDFSNIRISSEAEFVPCSYNLNDKDQVGVQMTFNNCTAPIHNIILKGTNNLHQRGLQYYGCRVWINGGKGVDSFFEGIAIRHASTAYAVGLRATNCGKGTKNLGSDYALYCSGGVSIHAANANFSGTQITNPNGGYGIYFGYGSKGALNGANLTNTKNFNFNICQASAATCFNANITGATWAKGKFMHTIYGGGVCVTNNPGTINGGGAAFEVATNTFTRKGIITV